MTDTLEVLLDGGAHHDFVNNDGKTAMDMARTHEARWILSEIQKTGVKVHCCQGCEKVWTSLFGDGSQNTGKIS